MKKHNLAPRKDYQETNETLGLDFGVVDGKPYWNEATAYSFTMKEIDKIEEATNDLHQMCFQAIPVSYTHLTLPTKRIV